jgi:hypothetical protein
MMKIIWRNPSSNPNGIIPSSCVVQISSHAPERGQGQVQITYRRVAASTGPAVEYEVLVNRKKSGYAGLGSRFPNRRKAKNQAMKMRPVNWSDSTLGVDRIAE